MNQYTTKDRLDIPLHYWIFGLVLGIGGLIVGSIYDYPIDIRLYSPDMFWARLLMAYGPVPCFWWVICGGLLVASWSHLQIPGLAFLHRNADDQKNSPYRFAHERSGKYPGSSALPDHPIPKWKQIVYLLIGYAAVFGSIAYVSKAAADALGIYWIFSLLLSIVLLMVPACIFYGELSTLSLDRQKRIVKIIILVCLGQFLIVHGLKWIVRRPRFLALLSESEMSFHPWWQNGWKTAHTYSSLYAQNSDLFKSFPSGHTAAAACSFLCCLLVMIRKDRSIKVFYIVALLFTMITAMSRMVLGYHFLSDVSTGFLITYLLFWYGWKHWIYPSMSPVKNSVKPEDQSLKNGDLETNPDHQNQ